MKRIHVLAVAALASGLQGCNTFYAEAEQPQVCLTLPTQSFTIPGGGGIVAPPGGFTASYSSPVDLGLSDVLPDFILSGPSSDRIVHFLSFDATVSGAPGANLDILSTLQVQALGAPGSTPVTLAQYVKGTRTGVRSISLESLAPGTNLADFLASGGLTVQVSGTVSVPGGQTVPAVWSAQVSSCLYAKIHKTFQQLIDGK